MISLRHRSLLTLLLLPVLAATPARLLARGQQFQHSTPAANVGSAANGLRSTLSYRPLEHFGYQRITLTLDALPAVNRDRPVTVRVYADRGFVHGTRRYDLAFEQDAEFPANASTLPIDLTLPRLHDWAMLRWEVWVDGQLDPQLSGVIPQQRMGGGPSVDLLRPTKRRGGTLIDHQDIRGGRLRGEGGYVHSSLEPLPTDWRELEGFHAVVLPLDDLQRLPEQDPKRHASLITWVRLGGRLVVEQVGREFERLAELEETLHFEREPFDRQLARAQRDDSREPVTGVEVTSAEDDPLPAAPQPPLPDHPVWRWSRVHLPFDPFAEPDPGGPPAELEFPPEEPGPTRGGRNRFGRRVEADGWFLDAPLGFGVVTAFPAELESLPSSNSSSSPREREFSGISYSRLYGALARNLINANWVDRHGMSPDLGAEEFPTWLVPGVGAAPVDAFRWLITLFVVLVGPVCYVALRRMHRTQLLVLTAPLAAAAFTLGLFAYATFSDGFGLRVRVRSLTLLDQPAGQSASWSRQTYYTGLAPAEGLLYPVTAAVYPVLPVWDSAEINDTRPFMREVLIEPEGQRLRSGWAESRQSTQLLVLNGAADERGLRFRSEADRLAVENHLGVAVDQLYVLDHEQRWWAAEQVPDGQATPLDARDRADVVAAVRPWLLEAAPAFPPGLDASSVRRNAFGYGLGESRPRDRLGRTGDAALSEGRLAQMIGAVEGRFDGLPVPLRPGTYLAITSRSACVPLGHPDARELGSVHLTLGAWREATP